MKRRRLWTENEVNEEEKKEAVEKRSYRWKMTEFGGGFEEAFAFPARLR